MATFHDPQGDTSNLSFVISGLSQLQKEGRSQRPSVCNPVLLGEEEKKRGITGFGADLYCPNCGERSDFILVEFGNPVKGSCPGALETGFQELTEDIMKCPYCGNTEMILESF